MARGRKSKKSRPMRYPNGYGTVFMLSNPERRRHPWVVKVPNGWKFIEKDGKKKSIIDYEVLCYCDSWEDGNSKLVEYNRKKALGVEVIKDNMTCSEVYEIAVKRKFEGAAKDTISSYSVGYKHCKQLYSVPVKDIKTAHMQIIIDKVKASGKSTSTLTFIKKVFNTVFEYAVQNDLTDKQYASYIKLGKPTKTKEKHIFTNDEIQKLFDNDTLPWVDTVLIMIFTGVRINELLKIKNKDVHLGERYLITGSKTDAGKNRTIPLNRKIIPYIEKRYDANHEYLIRDKKNMIIQKNHYRDKMFYTLMDKLNMIHTPHECRHTCASLMDMMGVNRVAQQLILGHKGDSVTEQVYIHKNLEQLLEAIDKI